MSKHGFPYSRAYNPPAPVVNLLVDGYDENVTAVPCTALVDSGADATMFPEDVLGKANAQWAGSTRMRGVTGVSEEFELYLVRIVIGQIELNGIQVLMMPAGSECIVGRDVLQHLIVEMFLDIELTVSDNE